MRQPPEAAELADSYRDAPGRETPGDPGDDSRGERPKAPPPGAGVRRARWRRWSIRRHLIALVTAVLGPLLVFAGLLLWQVAHTQRGQLQQQAVGLADTL